MCFVTTAVVIAGYNACDHAVTIRDSELRQTLYNSEFKKAPWTQVEEGRTEPTIAHGATPSNVALINHIRARKCPAQPLYAY